MRISLSKQIRHKIRSCIDANILVALVQGTAKISPHLVWINPIVTIHEQFLQAI
jgi:hypothetical protein